MSKPIPASAAAAQLSAYGVALFESLKEIKKVYPEQVRELYRVMMKHVANDAPDVVAELAL